MRDLIEEFVLLGITMILAGILVATFLFDFYVPEMGEYVETALPEQKTEHVDYTALSNIVTRISPTITASNIAIASGDVLDFNTYISNGTLKAVNADGDNISQYMTITPLDDTAKPHYDNKTKIFKDAVAGEYRFLLSVYDVSGSTSYGGEQSKIITVVVA